MTPSTDTVGFLGLGNLGAPMVRRLLEVGWRVTVDDPVPQKVESLTESGGRVGATSGDALDADILVLAVPDDEAVETELTDPAGYFRRTGENRLVVVHSTILPATAQRLAKEADAHGVAFLDAPVSGGSGRAATGELTVFLGGDDDAAARAKPLLSSVASTIEHVGLPGAGAATKLANQLMVFATLGGVHEALRLAECYGVDESSLLGAVRTGISTSWTTEHWDFWDETARAYTESGTPVQDRPWSKDLAEILTAARSADLNVPVAAVLSQTLAAYVEDHATIDPGSEDDVTAETRA